MITEQGFKARKKETERLGLKIMYALKELEELEVLTIKDQLDILVLIEKRSSECLKKLKEEIVDEDQIPTF